jgi:cation diffusion facilitator CzcD-associated flavoprotein CzcO
MKTHQENLPVAVIGAGPVGLAAAAHLIERGERPLVLEAGPSVGHTVRKWAHIRMFSPWRYNIDSASRRLLEKAGWNEPEAEHLPTGGEIAEAYLEPLASLRAMEETLRLGHRVIAVTREGLDKVRSHDRAGHPFLIRTMDAAGNIAIHRAKAVIDASGTWESPNPMGADGLSVPGEEAFSSRIDHGIPDLSGVREADFAGAHVLVVGSGHSSFNAILDLLNLKDRHPGTTITWAPVGAAL